MSFPTTGILDNFNRADVSPPSSSWTSPVNFGGDMDIVSNLLRWTASGGSEGEGYWNPTTFGPDSEAFITWTTVSFRMRLWIRITTPGSGTVDGYLVTFTDTTGAKVIRVDNGVETQLGAEISTTFSSGNSVGVEAVGSTLTVYKNTGTWAALDTRSDATYSSAGYIGTGSNQSSDRGDDFGGGTKAGAAVTPTVPIQIARGAIW